MKKIILYFSLLLCAVESFAQALLTDSNSRQSASFKLDVKIDTFQFQKTTLEKFPTYNLINKRINADIANLAGNFKKNFGEDVSGFSAPEISLNYSLDIKTQILCNSEKVFSACILVYSYTGGAHGNSEEFPLNFIIENNTVRELKWNDFLDGEKTDKIFKLALSKLPETIKRDYYNFPKDFASVKNPIEKYGAGFALDGENFIVIFPKYSIACGAAGVVRAKIPFAEISEFLGESGKLILKKIK